MEMKYNIALLPRTQGAKVIELAQDFFHIANTYLLGAQSLPHVTLCHFFAEETALLAIWEKTLAAIKPDVIHLTFPAIHYGSHNNTLFWVSLLPDKLKELKNWHLLVADIVGEPVSRSYDLYDPHMTLLNTRLNSADATIERAAKKYVAIEDDFFLALGKTDDAGQFTEIVFSR